MARENVKIELTSDVALVLFEWIEAQADAEWSDLSEVHLGEIAALSALAGYLQTELVEPFEADYNATLAAARQRLAEDYFGTSDG